MIEETFHCDVQMIVLDDDDGKIFDKISSRIQVENHYIYLLVKGLRNQSGGGLGLR